MIPEDRHYTKTHEWLKVDGDSALLGITDHAQQQLGDITFVEFPEPGQRLAAGEVCMTVESVKAASDIYLPVGGTVREVNASLEDHPELLNQDPHGEGWLIRIEGLDPVPPDVLLDAKSYEAMLKEDA